MPGALLALGATAALLTANAFRPPRLWIVQFPAFLAALAVSEGAGWWLLGLGVATGTLGARGGLAGWPGWVGLGLAAASGAGLAYEMLLARRASRVFDASLAAVDHAPPSTPGPRTWGEGGHRTWGEVLFPLWLRDRRVERIADLRYAPGSGRRHLLDVYRHPSVPRCAPVLLQIHGGAWTVGTKRAQGRPLMNHLARRGWVCVAINHRLSPRVRFPEHLVDCKLALRWVREHIAEYGGDPALVAVTGGSSGGHLAALVALTAGDPAAQPGFEDVDTSVFACVPMYGAYSLAELFALRGLGRRVGVLLGRLLTGVSVLDNELAYQQASPLHVVAEGAPPFMVVHGTADNLVPVEQARRFVLSLRAVDPDTVVYVELPGAPHAFDVLRTARAKASAVAIERFLNWALDGRAAGARSASGGGATTDPTTTARTAPS